MKIPKIFAALVVLWLALPAAFPAAESATLYDGRIAEKQILTPVPAAAP